MRFGGDALNEQINPGAFFDNDLYKFKKIKKENLMYERDAKKYEANGYHFLPNYELLDETISRSPTWLVLWEKKENDVYKYVFRTIDCETYCKYNEYTRNKPYKNGELIKYKKKELYDENNMIKFKIVRNPSRFQSNSFWELGFLSEDYWNGNYGI